MKVTTVLGDIDSTELGYTSMHDHTFIYMQSAAEYMEQLFKKVPQSMRELKPENYSFFKSGSYLVCKDLQQIEDLDLLTKEYGYFVGIGGKSVCDPSPISVRGDVTKMQQLSKNLGMNLICATGLYHEMAIESQYRGQSEEFYYQLFKDEIGNGIDGTDVRPGLLKSALAAMTETEINIVNACIHLSAETGLSTHIHTEPTVAGDRLIEIVDSAVKKYGTNPDKILICHMDNRITMQTPVDKYLTDAATARNVDITLQSKLIEKGYNIGLDTWGINLENARMFMPDAFEHLKALILLLQKGYGDHIVLGNDFSDKLQTRTYGGHGVTRVFDFAIPKLKQLGFEADVQKLLYGNPKRILEHN